MSAPAAELPGLRALLPLHGQPVPRRRLEGFRTQFTCESFHPNTRENANWGGFCDTRIYAQVERALRLQVSDPDAANELWAAIDRRIVDAAPIVSLINLRAVDFVSKRIGNYQFNPEFGMLLDQLWVR